VEDERTADSVSECLGAMGQSDINGPLDDQVRTRGAPILGSESTQGQEQRLFAGLLRHIFRLSCTQDMMLCSP